MNDFKEVKKFFILITLLVLAEICILTIQFKNWFRKIFISL